jgi:hypothetical protein
MVVPFLQTSTFTGLISTKDNKTSQEWGDAYTTVQNSSAIWNSAENALPIVTNYLSTNNVFISSADIAKNLTVTGNIFGFGKYFQIHNSQSTGDYTIAANEGVAANIFSAAFNRGQASGPYSFAEGFNTVASGEISHAEGDTTLAQGNISHAEGFITQALGNFSHAEGESTTASGQTSHAEGESTLASGQASHAEGRGTVTLGQVSHAAGSYANAAYDRSWIWKGSTSTDVLSTTRSDQFMVFAEGGIALYNNVGIGTDSLDNALTVAGTVSTSQHGTSQEWSQAYSLIQANSGTYATTSYVNGNFLSLISGGLVQGPVQINNNLTVFGNLTASGTTTFANTVFTTTSSLSVVHLGSGPALYVGNFGDDHIATFVDLQNNLEMLHIGGLSSSFPNVGVKTGYPNKDFTVQGEISASGTIYDNAGNSIQWNEAYNIGTAYQSISSTFLTAETDSQTLTFTQSSVQLSITNGNTVSLSALDDKEFATAMAIALS